MERVKNKVRTARTGKGFTQEQLAQKVGVTRQTIGLIEKERYNPTISLCLKISRTLEESLGELFWLEVEE